MEYVWFLLAFFGIMALVRINAHLSEITSELKVLRRARVVDLGTSYEEKPIKVHVTQMPKEGY